MLVIDQTPNHETETEQFIRDCKSRFPVRFRWQFVAKFNLPNARNVGARMARGEYLLFCDDVIIPPVNLIELHMRNLTQTGVGAVTGSVFLKLRKRPPEPSALRAFLSGQGRNRVSPCEILPNGRFIEHWNYALPRCTTDSLRGCNMSVARKLAFDVGLFDEGFIGDAHREETDFPLRVRRHGYQIKYDPEAAVVHLSHPDGGTRVNHKTDAGKYYSEFYYNHAYFHAKNSPHRYLP